MNSETLNQFWDGFPVGKEYATTHLELSQRWGKPERAVRAILHELSLFDNGDNYILIRSSGSRGFYKTDDQNEISAYKRECLNKGRSVFAPVKKINRVLNQTAEQYAFENNLRVVREGLGMTQGEVCKQMKKHDKYFDKSMLSKMENGVCMPTPYQCIVLAQIYGTEPIDLINTDLYY